MPHILAALLRACFGLGSASRLQETSLLWNVEKEAGVRLLGFGE